jgi:hypothetical protein
VHNGQLFAGGYFATSGNQPNTFARWNGFSWVPAGDGEVTGGYEVPSVNALASFGGSLWVGGSFARAGASYSPYLAQYSCSCYVNCDNSTTSPILTANDFTCFLNNYVLGTSYANCDGSTVQPVLTANDFQCFMTKYAAGCT